MQKQPKRMKIEIKVTGDGSPTLYLNELDEHYHSTFGAVQESQHVFIGAGFNYCTAKELSVLEIGFGTGLNCLLTLLACLESGQSVRYTAVEKFPLPSDIWEKLDYLKPFPKANPELFPLLHSVSWNSKERIHSHFDLHKIETDLLQIDPATLPLVDLVYFDAFSPEKQPELWRQSIFEMLFGRMNVGGILVTYCAKGVVRRTLQSVGFRVERIPGPPGKREMLRASRDFV